MLIYIIMVNMILLWDTLQDLWFLFTLFVIMVFAKKKNLTQTKLSRLRQTFAIL